jgi:hypothetical protein
MFVGTLGTAGAVEEDAEGGVGLLAALLTRWMVLFGLIL